jgi:hypothetical protein
LHWRAIRPALERHGFARHAGRRYRRGRWNKNFFRRWQAGAVEADQGGGDGFRVLAVQKFAAEGDIFL